MGKRKQGSAPAVCFSVLSVGELCALFPPFHAMHHPSATRTAAVESRVGAHGMLAQGQQRVVWLGQGWSMCDPFSVSKHHTYRTAVVPCGST